MFEGRFVTEASFVPFHGRRIKSSKIRMQLYAESECAFFSCTSFVQEELDDSPAASESRTRCSISAELQHTGAPIPCAHPSLLVCDSVS